MTIDKSMIVELVLDNQIGERQVESHPLVREVEVVSDTLSAWWGRPVQLKASVLLPGGYSEGSGHAYPIRYNVAGYGGRYTRINQLTGDKDFMNWWTSDEAPRVINVFLDGEGPFGDSYQLDSDNSGPYGYALINELIPHIESMYRGTLSAETRFVDGCSTGGWVSLALQLFYPDQFNGTFSYSPDAVSFDNYQLVNIYRDQNSFVNEYGMTRPIMRDINGEPMVSWKDFVLFENVLGASNTYLNSGGQICSHTALYSPKGDNGLPEPLIDPQTGDINHAVAEQWKKYDLTYYCRENWTELGPELQEKIHIWMGDMDHFYLNTATRAFADFISQTSNPKSDAEIIFTPMEGHCTQYSHREVLMKIQDRLDEIL
jgi:S-formylglutathione hydrolase FrmB